MYQMTLHIPIIYTKKKTTPHTAILATSKMGTVMPITKSMPVSLNIAGKSFFFKPIRLIQLFEEKEGTMILASDMNRYKKENQKAVHKQLFQAIQEDQDWDIQYVSSEHLSYFLNTMTFPAASEILLS